MSSREGAASQCSLRGDSLAPLPSKFASHNVLYESLARPSSPGVGGLDGPAPDTRKALTPAVGCALSGQRDRPDLRTTAFALLWIEASALW